RYHDATFKGKIIEELNWNHSGKYTVRAKGMLNIHGVEQERIIKADISILPDKTIRIESVFSVLLTDHNIPVPRIVKEKLAEEIKVAVSARLEPHN
ncbi:MAG: YceI family protein, partial [Chitinophagaceae bacterium]|nr:YceI family protein [Chitinophagaceae bacterium]